MSDQQLIQPNWNAVGSVGYCEQYVERVFSQPELASCAWAAWLATPVKHTDQGFPTGAAVVLYFSYVATIDGVTKNWGHITVNDPAKGVIFSAPWEEGTTHAELSSVAEVERLYTTHENGGTQQVTYVGWSEYLANVRVAEPQGADMTASETPVDATTVALVYDLGLGRNPSTAEVDGWSGQTVEALLRGVWGSPEHAAYVKGSATSNATVLQPGTYQVN